MRTSQDMYTATYALDLVVRSHALLPFTIYNYMKTFSRLFHKKKRRRKWLSHGLTFLGGFYIRPYTESNSQFTLSKLNCMVHAMCVDGT